jgi:hypothetical protein
MVASFSQLHQVTLHKIKNGEAYAQIKRGIAGVHDLNRKVASLQHSPKLPPDFNVLLEWSDFSLRVGGFHCLENGTNEITLT